MWQNTKMEERIDIYYYLEHVGYTQTCLCRILKVSLRLPKVSSSCLQNERSKCSYCTRMSQKFLKVMQGKLRMIIKETVKSLTMVITGRLQVIVIYFYLWNLTFLTFPQSTCCLLIRRRKICKKSGHQPGKCSS